MPKTRHLIFTFVFVICLLIQILPAIRSGLNYSYGLGFWGPNGHDAIWHLSLINHIKNPLAIPMPVFAGQYLSNYHPFFDILIAELSRLTFVSTSVWLFQLFPIFSTIVFLILSYKLGKKITQKSSGGLWLMFLNSFANSLGWLVTLIKTGSIGGESLFWAMQSPSNQINQPYLLSIIFLLALILILLNKKLSKLNIFFVFLILVLAPITKAYSAIPAYIIFSYFTWQALHKKDYQPLILGVISLITAFFLFHQYNPHSSGLLIFQPFWFTNSMVESPDRFYWPHLANLLHTSNLIKVTLAELTAVFIFTLGNFSWRIIGILSAKRLPISFLVTIFVCFLIPLFFIQNGTAWNTIQFLYYGLLLANIYLVIYLIDHRNMVLNWLVIVTSLIAVIPSLQTYLGNPAPSALPVAEVSALKFLSQQPAGTVLTYPYDQFVKNNMSTPIPLYAYETTSYVAAYSKHQTFVDDYMNLANSGFDYQSRLKENTAFFLQKSEFQDRGFLINNQIAYIYLTGRQINKTSLDSTKMSLKKIYDQAGTIIYQVQK